MDTDKIFNTDQLIFYKWRNRTTYTKMAKEFGVSYTAIRKLFNQDTSIGLKAVYKIARGLNVELCEMFIKK
ncbi:MAG: helix-turn-helix transcriptional regulator [Clostridiales bacterium]|nr:helix-turn-helix transcriptional regulator [Clostridiales bacterium]